MIASWFQIHDHWSGITYFVYPLEGQSNAHSPGDCGQMDYGIRRASNSQQHPEGILDATRGDNVFESGSVPGEAHSFRARGFRC